MLQSVCGQTALVMHDTKCTGREQNYTEVAGGRGGRGRMECARRVAYITGERMEITAAVLIKLHN